MEEDDRYMTCEESIPKLIRMGLNGPGPSEAVVEQSKEDFCKIDFRQKVRQIRNKESVGDQDTNK